MINFNRTLEVAGTSGFIQPIKLVQYDDTLPVGMFEFTENGQPFDIPSGAKAKVRMRKADGKGVYNDATISGHTVQVVVTQQMTAAFGVGFLNIELSYDGGVKSSEPVQVVVLENAVQQGAIESADEFLTLDEIVKQVETLRQQTATDAAAAAASKTAAASSATAAQSARAGAEAAESRVNSIVAGNESYTKRQSRDMFARALKATAEKAEKLEIYPDEGSNVAVTSYGFTEQAGTGDPSPTNVREITVGGLQANLFPGFSKLGKYDISSEAFTQTSDGNVASEKFSCKPNTDYFISIQRSVASSLRVLFWDSNDLFLSTVSITSGALNPKGTFKTPAKAEKLAVASFSSGGNLSNYENQLLVYGKTELPYTPYTGAEYGTVVKTKGISEINNLIPLTAPLCDGDTVETYAKSGCDKELVLDGSSDEQWKFESSAKRFTLLISTLGDYPVASSTKIQLCNILNYDSALSTNTAFFVYGSAYGGGTTLFLSSGFAEDLDSLKTKLAENPIKIRYRSTNYEPRKDISVCLEKHKRFYYELNEDADWKLGGGSGTDQYYCVLPFTAKTGNEICSHFKRSTSAATENSFSTSGSIYIRTTSGMFNGVDGFKGYIAEQKTASKHITVECELATPITYAHDPIYLAAYPDGNGKFTVSGEKLVSAKYNKSLNREFEEFKAAMLAMVANLSL